MVLSILTEACNDPRVILEDFHRSRKKLRSPYQFLATPLPPVPGDQDSSFSLDLPVLDTWYKQNYVICDLLCLASFTEHNVFKVPPLIGNTYLPFIPFCSSVIFHCVKYTIFFTIRQLVDLMVSTFNCWVTLLRTFVYRSVVDVFFVSPGDLSGAEFAEWCYFYGYHFKKLPRQLPEKLPRFTVPPRQKGSTSLQTLVCLWSSW